MATQLKFNEWWQLNINSLIREARRENVDHPLIRRAFAFAVDYIFLGAIIGGGAVLMVLFEVSDDYWNLHNCVAIVFTLLYFTLGASRHWSGRTLGKYIFNIKVVRENGDAIGVGRALLRSSPIAILTNSFNIVRMVEAMWRDAALSSIAISILVLLLFGVLFVALLKLNRQGIHDLIASTKVIDIGFQATKRK